MANEQPTTLDKNSVCYWSSTGCFVSHLNLTGRNVQEDVLSKFNVLSEPYEHTEPKVLVKSQNIQAGNCKRVKCDTQKRGSYPYAKNKGIFTMMVVYLEHLCLLKQNTAAASGPVCQALPNGNPRSDHLGVMDSSAFSLHIHLHRCIHMCTYPRVCAERKTASITAIFTLFRLPLRAFWMISFMIWTWASVKNLAWCSP